MHTHYIIYIHTHHPCIRTHVTHVETRSVFGGFEPTVFDQFLHMRGPAYKQNACALLHTHMSRARVCVTSTSDRAKALPRSSPSSPSVWSIGGLMFSFNTRCQIVSQPVSRVETIGYALRSTVGRRYEGVPLFFLT